MSKMHSDNYLSIIEKNMVKHAQSAAKENEYILNSTARYHGIYVRTCYMPKIFSENEYEYFKELINDLYGIFDVVINAYFDDESYRQLFGFDETLEKLILRCDRKRLTIPIARIDIFYNEETKEFKFCEYNTDGSSAMNEDRELNNALRVTDAFSEFSRKNEVYSLDLFDSWVEAFEDMYNELDTGKKLRNVAIVDFLESASMEEFEEFKKHFEAKGYNTEICEIRNLTYDGEYLISENGMKIDAVYRRAVTSDIMKNLDEVSDFINAVADDKVKLFGDFFTQIIHNKILYKILWDPVTMDMLNEKQREYIRKHVPMTYMASSVDLNDIIKDKDAWILKPEDSYGSRGVYPGTEFTMDEWIDIVENKIDVDSYIVQEFYTPYKSYNYQLVDGELQKFGFYNLTGLYVYNGKLRGMYSRVSKDKIISTQYNEMAIPTVVVR